jgi:hypothetical protein
VEVQMAEREVCRHDVDPDAAELFSWQRAPVAQVVTAQLPNPLADVRRGITVASVSRHFRRV